jgi:hypothetical protein
MVPARNRIETLLRHPGTGRLAAIFKVRDCRRYMRLRLGAGFGSGRLITFNYAILSQPSCKALPNDVYARTVRLARPLPGTDSDVMMAQTYSMAIVKTRIAWGCQL